MNANTQKYVNDNVYFLKISILPPQKGLEIPGGGGGGGGSQRPRNVSKCMMKLDWNFHRGGRGGSEEESLLWGRYG